MLNKVMLIGHLGNDPEVRHLESGSVVAKFSLASNERYKDKSGELKEITEWHNVIVWRRLAEVAEKYLKKGSLVYVEGKLTSRKWTDSNNIERYTTEIVANNFTMLGGRANSGSGYSNNFPTEENEPVKSVTSAPSTQTPEQPQKVQSQESNDKEDDLPF